MSNINLIQFKSKPKKTFFAPEYEYSLFESFIDHIDFKDVAMFLLNKEKDILKLPYSRDGYTGLRKKSTTTRFNRFNVLKWKNKNIKLLKNTILNFHNYILQHFKQPLPKELYIQCWVNIMRKGEQIKPHLHDVSPTSYLGGHICVQCDDTSTYYINPINQINDPETHDSENKVGKITLFQSNIPHYTDIHKSNVERITIAFDLQTQNPMKNNYLRLI